MKRTLRITAVAVAVGGLLAGSAVTAAGRSAPASDRDQTLTFAVTFSPFFSIDFRGNSVRTVNDIRLSDPSKGDQVVFRDEITRNGQVVGHDGGSCTVTEVDLKAANPIQLACTATFDLPDGQIATQGLATNAPDKHLIIVGGTGRYRDSTGKATVTEFDNVHGRVVFELRAE